MNQRKPMYIAKNATTFNSFATIVESTRGIAPVITCKAILIDSASTEYASHRVPITRLSASAIAVSTITYSASETK